MTSTEALENRILAVLDRHKEYDAETIVTLVGADLGDVRSALFVLIAKKMLIDERVVEEDAPAEGAAVALARAARLRTVR